MNTPPPAPGPSVKDAQALLELAARLGVDQKEVSAQGFAVCIVLRAELQHGRVDAFRFGILKNLIGKISQSIDEHLLAFQYPTQKDGISTGEIEFLQTVLTRLPVHFDRLLLRRGFQVFSATGYGKSTLLLHLARNWCRLQLPCLVFAAKPDQFYFRLARWFPDRCLILKCGVDVFYNGFSSVSGNVGDFISTKLPYWQAIYNRWDSAALIAHLYQPFKDDQLQSGQVAPTLDYLISQLEVTRFPRDLFNPQLKPSVYSVLTMMREGPLGVSMACQRGLALDQIFAQGLIVVIETATMNDADTHYLVTSMLTDLRKTKELNPGLDDVLVIVDEAGPLLAQRWTSGTHASPMASEIVLLRGSGICLATGYHSICSVNPQVLANSAITLIGGLTSGEDIMAAAQAAALSADQRTALSHLRIGQAILKLSGTNYTEPVPVTWEIIP